MKNRTKTDTIDLVSERQAAREFNLPGKTLPRLRRLPPSDLTPRPPHYQIGNRFYYDRRELDEWLRSVRRAPGPARRIQEQEGRHG